MAAFVGDEDEFEFEATGADDGTRLDVLLAKACPDISRSRLKALILDGEVFVNGDNAIPPKLRIKTGDLISLTLPPPVDALPEPQDIPLSVLYEDDDLIVIDKPAGMVVHPAPGAPDHTLVNALLFHCGDSLKGIGGVKRPGIVHRLDKETTGVMVAAKTEQAHNHLAAQFADHGLNGPLRRAYTAYVWGFHQRFAGTIDAPIGRDPANRLKQAIRQTGRHAVTHFQTIARFGGEGWQMGKLECRLETGRTHQIRVHMAHVGHPVVADPLYASGFQTKSRRLPDPLRSIVDGLGRQALHAAELGFEHPSTGEFMLFEAPLPADLQALDGALVPFSLVNPA
ncbi:MAG: RluA family pseudouridine synthase [Hyphomicrobiaceae bacterium]|nr:RluA family pseudouridine synthase [Hyphomicrobiaceae bacterium]